MVAHSGAGLFLRKSSTAVDNYERWYFWRTHYHYCSCVLPAEPPARRSIAWAGGLVALALVLMKVLPFIPGHFTRDEGIALGVWALLGAMTWLSRKPSQAKSPDAG